jgi:purine-nucleoside phosphorylase
MSDYYGKVRETAAWLKERFGKPPDVAIVLGSGLGELTRALNDAVTCAYADVPNWPASAVVGHAGQLVVGTIRGKRVAALSGRAHFYEGHDLRTVTFGVRALATFGVRTIILTNAAGGINLTFKPGTLMLMDDHINLLGSNPLVGPNDERFGPRFPDMTEVYSNRLRTIAVEAASSLGQPLARGIYVALHGPSYETPAEIRFLRTIGADAVGMSTVPEAIVARHMGLEVLGISCITNPAAGVLPKPLVHDEVMEVANRVRAEFSALPAAPESERRHGQRRSGPERRDERAWQPVLIDSGVQDTFAPEDGLLAAARAAREFAQAPYSRFKVGAALETVEGVLVTGCNIENATYGLTLCAERVALVKALSDGVNVFTRIAVVADTQAPTPPCGPCRQLLWEYCGDIEILLGNLQTLTGRYRLSSLLPLPFDRRLL